MQNSNKTKTLLLLATIILITTNVSASEANINISDTIFALYTTDFRATNFDNGYSRGDYDNAVAIAKRKEMGQTHARLWTPRNANYTSDNVYFSWSAMDWYVDSAVKSTKNNVIPIIVFGGYGSETKFLWLANDSVYTTLPNRTQYELFVRSFIEHYRTKGGYNTQDWYYELLNEPWGTGHGAYQTTNTEYVSWLNIIIDNLTQTYPNYKFGGNPHNTLFTTFLRNLTNNSRFVDLHNYGVSSGAYNGEYIVNETQNEGNYNQEGIDCVNYAFNYGKSADFACILGEYNWNSGAVSTDNRKYEPMAGAYTASAFIQVINGSTNRSVGAMRTQGWNIAIAYEDTDAAFGILNYSGGNFTPNYQWAFINDTNTILARGVYVRTTQINDTSVVGAQVFDTLYSDYKRVMLIVNLKNSTTKVTFATQNYSKIYDRKTDITTVNLNMSHIIYLNPFEYKWIYLSDVPYSYTISESVCGGVLSGVVGGVKEAVGWLFLVIGIVFFVRWYYSGWKLDAFNWVMIGVAALNLVVFLVVLSLGGVLCGAT